MDINNKYYCQPRDNYSPIFSTRSHHLFSGPSSNRNGTTAIINNNQVAATDSSCDNDPIIDTFVDSSSGGSSSGRSSQATPVNSQYPGDQSNEQTTTRDQQQRSIPPENIITTISIPADNDDDDDTPTTVINHTTPPEDEKQQEKVEQGLENSTLPATTTSNNITSQDTATAATTTTTFPNTTNTAATNSGNDSNSSNNNNNNDLPEHPYNHIDVEWSVREMDRLFKASFHDFIRDERNVDCTCQHLAPLIKDYKMRQIAQGLGWLVDGWKSESIAKLLKNLFRDWLPDVAGVVFAILSADWEFQSTLSLCTAFLLIKESASTSGTFLASWVCSREWKTIDGGIESPNSRAQKATELISYLDCVLQWNASYFQEFTSRFFASFRVIDAALREVSIPFLIKDTSVDAVQMADILRAHEKGGQEEMEALLKHLSQFYQTSLAVTNYKMAIEEFNNLSEDLKNSCTCSGCVTGTSCLLFSNNGSSDSLFFDQPQSVEEAMTAVGISSSSSSSSSSLNLGTPSLLYSNEPSATDIILPGINVSAATSTTTTNQEENETSRQSRHRRQGSSSASSISETTFQQLVSWFTEVNEIL